MTQPESNPQKLTRRQQRERRWRSNFTYIDAPPGVTTAEAIQYLANRTLDAVMRRSRAVPRWKRDLRSLAGRGILRGDTGVSFWMLNRESAGPRDWRCVVRRGSHWFPLSITLSTCETQRRSTAHYAAFKEAVEAVPRPSDVFHCSERITGSERFFRLNSGTPEEEAQRDMIYERCYAALLARQERPPPSIRIQWPERASEKWRYLVLTLFLDIYEDAIDDSLAQQLRMHLVRRVH